jgi:hypothetical protein
MRIDGIGREGLGMEKRVESRKQKAESKKQKAIIVTFLFHNS